MTWWGQIVRRARADRELAREIQAHIAERVDDLVDGGMSSGDARRTALREFGNPVCCVEDSRSVWLIPWLVSLGQDVRYVLRTIRRQPVFSVSVVLILTFGIGLVTALFTVFNATVLRPWPVPDPSSIVVIKSRPAAGDPYGTLSNLEYRYFREHARSFSHLASSITGGSPVGRKDGSMFATVQSQYVTANYFDALRIGMAVGRGFLPEEEDYRAPKAVVVISERVWRRVLRERSGPGRQPDSGRRPAGDGRWSCRTRIRWCPRLASGSISGCHCRRWRSPQRETLGRLAAVVRQPAADLQGRCSAGSGTGVTAEEARAELDVLSRQFRAPLGMEAPGLLLGDTRPLSTNHENVRGRIADAVAHVVRPLPRDVARLRQRGQPRPGEDRRPAGRNRHQAVARRQPVARGSTADHGNAGALAHCRLGRALPGRHGAGAADPTASEARSEVTSTSRRMPSCSSSRC